MICGQAFFLFFFAGEERKMFLSTATNKRKGMKAWLQVMFSGALKLTSTDEKSDWAVYSPSIPSLSGSPVWSGVGLNWEPVVRLPKIFSFSSHTFWLTENLFLYLCDLGHCVPSIECKNYSVSVQSLVCNKIQSVVSHDVLHIISIRVEFNMSWSLQLSICPWNSR